jgi:hypothetical protein
MVAKASSVSTIAAASFATSLLQGRRVVDPIAGHRDNISAGLMERNKLKLLRRGDTGENIRGQDPAPLGFGQRRLGPDFVALDDDPIPIRQTNLGGDLARRHRMVSGDHDDPDASVMAGPDRGGDVFARRIAETDQTEKNKPVIGGRIIGQFQFRRHREDAQPILGKGAGALEPDFAPGDVEPGFACGARDPVRVPQHRLRCALDASQESIAQAMSGRHHRGLGIERYTANLGRLPQQRSPLKAGIAPGQKKRNLDRITGSRTFGALQLGIVAEHRNRQRPVKGRVRVRGLVARGIV